MFFYEDTKHIKLDCFIIHEKFQQRLISGSHVLRDEQLADVFSFGH